MPTPVVEVRNLRKTYGAKTAVADVSFAIERGEIFGILGPNGAGKTTTVECLAGLRHADAGAVRVLGIDTQTHPERVRDLLGVQLQEAELHPKMTVAEALEMYASFYADPADIEDLIRLLDLAECRDRQFGRLSGGQRQRLSVALALVGNPQVAILDELTTGLDPAARRTTWELVERVRDAGVTIVLVTHFMDEAERLCDRLVVIDRGQVVAQGTPRGLIDALEEGRTLRLRPAGGDVAATVAALEPLVGGEDVTAVTPLTGGDAEIEVRGSRRAIVAVVQALAAAGLVPDDVATVRRTLEDVFVTVTGRTWDAEGADGGSTGDAAVRSTPAAPLGGAPLGGAPLGGAR